VGIHLCLNMRFWTGSFEIRRSPMCDLQTSTRQRQGFIGTSAPDSARRNRTARLRSRAARDCHLVKSRLLVSLCLFVRFERDPKEFANTADLREMLDSLAATFQQL